MNDDHDLESMLRRFTVRGPDPQVRHAILEPAGVARWWGPAAAAAILIGWAAVNARHVEPRRDPMRDSAVRTIAAAVGGGEDAERYAEAVVPPLGDVVTVTLPEEPW